MVDRGIGADKTGQYTIREEADQEIEDRETITTEIECQLIMQIINRLLIQDTTIPDRAELLQNMIEIVLLTEVQLKEAIKIMINNRSIRVGKILSSNHIIVLHLKETHTLNLGSVIISISLTLKSIRIEEEMSILIEDSMRGNVAMLTNFKNRRNSQIKEDHHFKTGEADHHLLKGEVTPTAGETA